MTTGLSTLEDIITLLNNNSTLVEKIKDRIFPIIAKENTMCPFIVCKRETIGVSYCKDGNYQDLVTVSVSIISNYYTESIELAELVRETIELKKSGSIKNIRLESCIEDYVEDNNSYLQQLTFEIQY